MTGCCHRLIYQMNRGKQNMIRLVTKKRQTYTRKYKCKVYGHSRKNTKLTSKRPRYNSGKTISLLPSVSAVSFSHRRFYVCLKTEDYEKTLYEIKGKKYSGLFFLLKYTVDLGLTWRNTWKIDVRCSLGRI